jgi:hypothetical protein
MPRRRPYLAALVLAGVVTAASGCTGTPAPERHPVLPTLRSVAPSPEPTPARGELVTALKKLASGPFTYHVKSNLPSPQGGNVDATGGYDHAARIFEERVTLTGTSADGRSHRIVVGHDSYSRTDEAEQWVHLDLARLKSQVLVGIDMDDPTGLSHFVTAVTRATRTGPHSFQGRFNPLNDDQFIPIGYPNLVVLAFGSVPFTVATDGQGNVTSIHIEVESKDEPKLVMTTTFAGHDQPLTTRRPAKKKTAEAAERYYG